MDFGSNQDNKKTGKNFGKMNQFWWAPLAGCLVGLVSNVGGTECRRFGLLVCAFLPVRSRPEDQSIYECILCFSSSTPPPPISPPPPHFITISQGARNKQQSAASCQQEMSSLMVCSRQLCACVVGMVAIYIYINICNLSFPPCVHSYFQSKCLPSAIFGTRFVLQ